MASIGFVPVMSTCCVMQRLQQLDQNTSAFYERLDSVRGAIATVPFTYSVRKQLLERFFSLLPLGGRCRENAHLPTLMVHLDYALQGQAISPHDYAQALIRIFVRALPPSYEYEQFVDISNHILHATIYFDLNENLHQLDKIIEQLEHLDQNMSDPQSFANSEHVKFCKTRFDHVVTNATYPLTHILACAPLSLQLTPEEKDHISQQLRKYADRYMSVAEKFISAGDADISLEIPVLNQRAMAICETFDPEYTDRFIKLQGLDQLLKLIEENNIPTSLVAMEGRSLDQQVECVLLHERVHELFAAQYTRERPECSEKFSAAHATLKTVGIFQEIPLSEIFHKYTKSMEALIHSPMALKQFLTRIHALQKESLQAELQQSIYNIHRVQQKIVQAFGHHPVPDEILSQMQLATERVKSNAAALPEHPAAHQEDESYKELIEQYDTYQRHLNAWTIKALQFNSEGLSVLSDKDSQDALYRLYLALDTSKKHETLGPLWEQTLVELQTAPTSHAALIAGGLYHLHEILSMLDVEDSEKEKALLAELADAFHKMLVHPEQISRENIMLYQHAIGRPLHCLKECIIAQRCNQDDVIRLAAAMEKPF